MYDVVTSYFGYLKNIDTSIYEPIAICGKSPEWYTGYQYKKLAPKYWFFKEYKDGKITDKEYTTEYYAAILMNADRSEILKDLKGFSLDKIPCMLCYEKPKDFCHRHIVKEWFNNWGYNCEELS